MHVSGKNYMNTPNAWKVKHYKVSHVSTNLALIPKFVTHVQIKYQF